MFTAEELSMMAEGIRSLITSAQRQQNMKGKTPMIKAVYEKQEQILKQLELKITAALTDAVTQDHKKK